LQHIFTIVTIIYIDNYQTHEFLCITYSPSYTAKVIVKFFPLCQGA